MAAAWIVRRGQRCPNLKSAGFETLPNDGVYRRCFAAEVTCKIRRSDMQKQRLSDSIFAPICDSHTDDPSAKLNHKEEQNGNF